MASKTKISEEERAYRISRKAQVEGEKKEYLERKRKLVPIEAKNFDKIVIFMGTKGYWAITGHSAIILNEMVAPDIKMKVSLRKDTDFDCSFSEGIISVRDLDYYKMNLPQCRLLKKEYVEKPQSVTFYLKDPLSPEQYDLISHAEEIKSEKLLNMVSSSAVMPSLYKMVRDLSETAMILLKKTDRLEQQTIGIELMRDVIQLERAFLLGARTESALGDALNEMEAQAKAVLLDVKIAEDMGVWRVGQCWRIGSIVSQILTQVPVERKARKIKQ